MSWKSRSIFAGLTALMWMGFVVWDLFNTVTLSPGTWRLDRVYIGLISPILLLMSVLSLVLFIRHLRKQASYETSSPGYRGIANVRLLAESGHLNIQAHTV